MYMEESNIWEEKNLIEPKQNCENNPTIVLNDTINETEKSVIENQCCDTGNEKKWTRKCPKCGKDTHHSKKEYRDRAIRKNTKCIKCNNLSMTGVHRVLPEKLLIKLSKLFKGVPRSQKTKDKISKALKGKPLSEETKRKLSKALIGNIPWNKGKPATEEQKYKNRVATIKDLQRKGIFPGCEFSKNYNPKACKFIDEIGKKLGYNFQHALNGGEIELYGYFVDGYDKEKNIIVEYDEPKHNLPPQIKKDMLRQENLIREIKPTLFLRYNEEFKKLYDCQTGLEININYE